MQVIETQGRKFSVSVKLDQVNFIGEDGKDASRTATFVTIWEHLNTNRKYQHVMPIAQGVSFCQPNDDYDFALGARQAATRALDSLGYRSNIHPVVKAVHQLVKSFVNSNDPAYV